MVKKKTPEGLKLILQKYKKGKKRNMTFTQKLSCPDPVAILRHQYSTNFQFIHKHSEQNLKCETENSTGRHKCHKTSWLFSRLN